MHLVARATYRTGAYMYRKDDAPSRSSILLSSKEYNSTEELKIELEFEKSVVKKFITMFKSDDRKKNSKKKISKVYRKLEEKLKID